MLLGIILVSIGSMIVGFVVATSIMLYINYKESQEYLKKLSDTQDSKDYYAKLAKEASSNDCSTCKYKEQLRELLQKEKNIKT